jgi:hypothetical protein
MLTVNPRLRIRGHGRRLRVRRRGNWCIDQSATLRESCRASMAIEKTLMQAIGTARATGMSWNHIGRVLGATDAAESRQQLIDALVDNRRTALGHLLRETD